MSRRLPARAVAAIALALLAKRAFGAIRGLLGDDLITVITMLVLLRATVSVGQGILGSGAGGSRRPAGLVGR